ncbi:ATP-binding cassette domain-containing protein, partial [bacterium]|nr:ATP-binding cassette domain-containing protein [bacterium]
PNGTIKLDGLRDAIVFDKVSFSYDRASGPALRDVSIRFAAGQTTALVGASGAGKSTLVDLIPRFYDISQGSIQIDGIDLRSLDIADWRARIGFVSQDPFLFSTTIRDNIAFGCPGATTSDAEAAAERANASEFIARLPEGLDTPIGDRGVMLSGGQRQRIAMARAILRDPQLLILDEATSALDAVSEKLFQQALARLSQDRTVLVIAHRLSTIVDADRVVVLSNGSVTEQGTHQDLLDRKGDYWQFHTLQDVSASALEEARA